MLGRHDFIESMGHAPKVILLDSQDGGEDFL